MQRSLTLVILTLFTISLAAFAQWSDNPQVGTPISTAEGDQNNHTSASDGAGGALITWEDLRGGNFNNDIYAQHINAAGVVQWTADGVAVCKAANDQLTPTIVSDGAGGAFITWEDRRGASLNIYAQRINAAGVVQWTADGVAISPTTFSQYYPMITSDGAGGAIITWQDFRGANNDIYAQRINSAGVVQWSVEGVAICTAASEQYFPTIVSDGAGGAVITWQDDRSGNKNIYAQRINAAGVVQWTADGVAICKATSERLNHTSASDGAGGAIITWQDEGTGRSHIYAQRINTAGVVQWGADGVAICLAPFGQEAPAIVNDGAGGAVITWQDYRGKDLDIYAQKIGWNGFLADGSPHILSVRDVKNDQGGIVNVLWTRSPFDVWPDTTITSYTIWRGVKLNGFSSIHAPGEGAGYTRISVLNSPTKNTMAQQKFSTTTLDTIYWQEIGRMHAQYRTGYAFATPTLTDSSPKGNPYSYFTVTANTQNQLWYWDSPLDSGYSVDNIPPIAPRNPTGSIVTSTVMLHWNRNGEDDLAGYEVYRGATQGFNPDTMAALVTTRDTSYADVHPTGGSHLFYAVRALDVHGNRSPKSVEVALVLLGVFEKSEVPKMFMLSQNYPNPFNPTTIIEFTLPEDGKASLKIYDMLGREVATLVNGELKSGVLHQATFDASKLSSGIYFSRLEYSPAVSLAGNGKQLMKKLILVK